MKEITIRGSGSRAFHWCVWLDMQSCIKYMEFYTYAIFLCALYFIIFQKVN